MCWTTSCYGTQSLVVVNMNFDISSHFQVSKRRKYAYIGAHLFCPSYLSIPPQRGRSACFSIWTATLFFMYEGRNLFSSVPEREVTRPLSILIIALETSFAIPEDNSESLKLLSSLNWQMMKRKEIVVGKKVTKPPWLTQKSVVLKKYIRDMYSPNTLLLLEEGCMT